VKDRVEDKGYGAGGGEGGKGVERVGRVADGVIR